MHFCFPCFLFGQNLQKLIYLAFNRTKNKKGIRVYKLIKVSSLKSGSVSHTTSLCLST